MKREYIKNIYKKFKSYVYYDNASLHLRTKTSRFETNDDFEAKLERLLDFINNLHCFIDKDYLNKLLEEIDILVIPKKFKDDNIESSVSNLFTRSKYIVEKINYLFDGPIELHLICFFWILKYGKILEKLYFDYNYANIFHSNCANIKDRTTKTFKPYFEQYAKWRDNGILKAQELHKRNEGSAILMLDISSYYYSVNMDFSSLDDYILPKLKNDEVKQYRNITRVIKKIFIEYNDKLSLLKDEIINKQLTLPLGICISPILANWYLHEMDKKIVKSIQPFYYGRYVDDIMIVLPESSYKETLRNDSSLLTRDFIKYNFIENSNIFYETENNEYILADNYYKVVKHKDIKVQLEKMKLYIIDKDGTTALMQKFVDNIRKNSSEFRFLPEESKVVSEFYDDAYSMLYNDTQNKLRSIENFRGNKYGISKYLAKIIFSSKYWNDSYDSLELLVEQVDSFFKGKHCLEYYTLWEKIFTFYLINERYDRINNFYNRIIKEIKKIKVLRFGRKAAKKLRDFMRIYLDYSLGLSISLNYNCLTRLKGLSNSIEEYAVLYRKSNMLKHNYLIVPLINYLVGSDDIDNLLSFTLFCMKDGITLSRKCNKCDTCELELDNSKLRLSPRYIHYHEFQHYYIFKEAYKWENGNFGEYIEKSKELFMENNAFNSKEIEKKLPSIDNLMNETLINNIKIASSKNLETLRIGVGSIKIDGKNIEKSYLRRPNLSRNRLINLFRLLNYIERENCDLIVLPEVSIPFAWLGILTKFSQKQQKALIFGIEHIINRNNYALNLLATVLPFQINGLNYSFTRLRLKNHYSPNERRLLLGYRYKLPDDIKVNYDIFDWRGVLFSCFNCFELADITHRALFRSKVDFLTASEYNKDINYFSNIVESVTRDVHCYFIQSNSSDYGDSRITKPSKTVNKDILRLKGGLNDTILIGEINIKQLREFQYKEYELQKDDTTFKPTPPNFDKEEVGRRLIKY